MSRVKIRKSSSLASDSPMQWRLPGFEKITLATPYLRISTNSKRKESFMTHKPSFVVKKSFWLEFVGLFPVIGVPGEREGFVKR